MRDGCHDLGFELGLFPEVFIEILKINNNLTLLYFGLNMKN